MAILRLQISTSEVVSTCSVCGVAFETRLKKRVHPQITSALALMQTCLHASDAKHPASDAVAGSETWFQFFGARLAEHLDQRWLENHIEKHPRPVRVLIEALDQESAFAPWELCHVQIDGEQVDEDALGADKRTAVSRLYRPRSKPLPAPLPRQDKRIRVLLVVLEHENASLDPGMFQQTLEQSADIELTVWSPEVLAAAIDEMRSPGGVRTSRPRPRALDGVDLAEMFDVIHIVAHGEQAVTMQNHPSAKLDGGRRGGGEITVSDLLPVVRGRCQVLILHACNGSAMAPGLIEGGVPTVVAMLYSIQIARSFGFVTAFYQALIEGDPLDVAVQAGRLALYKEARSCAGAPVLYTWTDEVISIAGRTKTVAPSTPTRVSFVKDEVSEPAITTTSSTTSASLPSTRTPPRPSAPRESTTRSVTTYRAWLSRKR